MENRELDFTGARNERKGEKSRLRNVGRQQSTFTHGTMDGCGSDALADLSQQIDAFIGAETVRMT